MPQTKHFFFKLFFLFSFIAITSGCSSYGVITNIEQRGAQPIENNYSMQKVLSAKPQGDIALVLAFSGGGTRAAALSYGVLEALQQTKISDKSNLLDEVDIISSVSGGSFTAAYYGLNGNRTFNEYKEQVLMTDIESELIGSLFNPLRWFAPTGRTQTAIDFYNQQLFDGKTFADLNRPGSPLILINASDLANGVRFTFTQEYFDFICSDIKDIPIAKAVAASTAVPIIFNPVVLKNFQPCDNGIQQRFKRSNQFVKENEELRQAIKGLLEYTNTTYPYLHLVDGGITDNLGLRAIYEAVELYGGPKRFMQAVQKQQTQHLVVISVDASTKSTGSQIKLSNKVPTTLQSVNAMTDIQIHRYNSATKHLFEESLNNWAKQLSTPQKKVEAHFVQISFDQLATAELQAEFNQIPTSLTLTEPEVDKLIEAGQTLLQENLDFQLLMRSLDNRKKR